MIIWKTSRSKRLIKGFFDFVRSIPEVVLIPSKEIIRFNLSIDRVRGYDMTIKTIQSIDSNIKQSLAVDGSIATSQAFNVEL